MHFVMAKKKISRAMVLKFYPPAPHTAEHSQGVSQNSSILNKKDGSMQMEQAEKKKLKNKQSTNRCVSGLSFK
jgi:hypothetical protein